MIQGFFHQGSGLGNQLHRYIATRVRALDLGVDWGMMYNPDGSGKDTGFKGKSFMDIGQWDKGSKKEVQKFEINQDAYMGHPKDTSYLPNEPQGEFGYWQEKCVRDDVSGVDIRSYDPEFNFIEDNTIIEGEFQDERYWEHREKEVDEWLKVEPLEMPDDLCVIGFRGGEFALYPDLFLPKEYYTEAIAKMLEVNPGMRFEVHTDDEALAREFFLDFKVIHDIGINWRSMRFAKYAIISNSSFFILPRWLAGGKTRGNDKYKLLMSAINKEPITIAPRFWGRRNTKVWSLPQNYYKRFSYI